MVVRKPIRMKKLARRASAQRATKSARAAWWTNTPMIAGGVIAVFVAAVLAGWYQAGDKGNARLKTDSKIAHAEVAESAATAVASPASDATVDVDASHATSVDQVAGRSQRAVTITGCLERSDEAFRLTDTAGESAPTSRSWKSAFLKKRSATIEIVAPRPLNLTSHVGQRVSVTGTLVDRQMHVASLRRMASSCVAIQKVKA